MKNDSTCRFVTMGEIYKATRICAWCGKHMGTRDGFKEKDAVTGGVCEKCLRELMRKIKTKHT